MKRLLPILLIAVFAISTATAQTSREELDANPSVILATHSTYAGPYYAKPIADAPKGYKPFYISHYGRHGSRYESRSYYMEDFAKFFNVADSLGVLTAKGKEVKAIANKIYAEFCNCTGELTSVGVEQHKGIARRMYERFRPIFNRGSIINSRSSTHTRCILSMAAFNESLKECEPLIETRLHASVADISIMRPMGKETTSYHHDYRYGIKTHPWIKILNEWQEKQDFSHAIKAVFTDITPLCKYYNESAASIMVNIYKRLAFTQNHGWYDRSLLDSIFTADERHTIYRIENYRWFCLYGGTSLPDANKYFRPMHLLVDDIVKYADLAVEGKNSASADLRFGHDYYLLGLLATANFNEIRMDYDYSDVEKLGEEWRSYKFITMASNMQFIFYRSKKNPDVLVRILHNENDVTLPIESATAPFYKWEDVRKYLIERVNAFRK